MAKIWNYGENGKNIVLNEPPKKRLRITGHRFASVLGLDDYKTPFGAWCEITNLVKLPFEDTKYTLAGKVIEPKLIEYVSKTFTNCMSIEDYYGNNIERYRWNNFIDDSDVFGGIIDAVCTKNDLKTISMVVECKTSSKPQLWENNNVPIAYLLQGAEYSYLKGLDRVLFICAFLQESDYSHPEMFVPNDTNTKMVLKSVKDINIELPNGELITFDGAIEYCENWWKEHIETGISPEFDEEKDKEYLDIIRTSRPVNDSSLDEIHNKMIKLENKINKIKDDNKLDDLEKEFKTLKDNLKEALISTMDSTDTKTIYGEYKVTKKTNEKFDEKSFKKNNEKLYKQYVVQEEKYDIRKLTKAEKEGK